MGVAEGEGRGAESVEGVARTRGRGQREGIGAELEDRGGGSQLRTAIITAPSAASRAPARRLPEPDGRREGDGDDDDLTATSGGSEGASCVAARAAGERDVTATMEASSGVRTCVMTRDCEVMPGAGGGGGGGGGGVRAHRHPFLRVTYPPAPQATPAPEALSPQAGYARPRARASAHAQATNIYIACTRALERLQCRCGRDPTPPQDPKRVPPPRRN